MEIMKNLRSVTRNSEGKYEYFRVSVEEAARLMSIGGYIYISKEEYKRQSKFYQDRPCDGTLVNINPFIDEEGNKITQRSLNNINWEKLLIKEREFPSSTKIAKCSSTIKDIRRKNKYAIKKEKSNTVMVGMRMKYIGAPCATIKQNEIATITNKRRIGPKSFEARYFPSKIALMFKLNDSSVLGWCDRSEWIKI